MIQVTRWPEGFLTLREAARRAGLPVSSGRLGSLEAARLAAELAYRGLGTRVKVIEEKTRILVARGHRGRRPGGMSRPRYNRRVRSAILRMTREIRRRLDEEGLDYDLVFRKSEGGLERAVFIVYAPRDAVRGVVKPIETTDIRVEVRPIYSSRIEFEQGSETHAPTHLIVGVDPGSTLGLALLDLHGRPVLLASYKEFDRTGIIGVVEKHGIPVLMATDVRNVPEAVRKLAAAFNVPVYSPSQDLSTLEKHEIAQSYVAEYGVRIPDTHVRDALAAAVKAYRSLENKLSQAEAYLSRIGLELSREAIKAAIVRGKSIAEALEEQIETALSVRRERRREAPRTSEAKGREPSPREQRLEDEVRRLRLEKASLSRQLRELRWRVEELEYMSRLRSREVEAELLRDREVEQLRRRNRRLAEKIRELEEELEEARRKLEEMAGLVLKAASGDLIPALILDKISSSVLAGVGDLEGRVVYVSNPNIYELEAVEQLARKKAAGVLLDEAEGGGLIDALRRRGVPVLPLQDHLAYRGNGLILLRPEVLERLEEERRRLERRERSIDLARIIEEYRARRKRM